MDMVYKPKMFFQTLFQLNRISNSLSGSKEIVIPNEEQNQDGLIN